MSDGQDLDQLLQDQDGDSDLVKRLRKVIRDQTTRAKEAEKVSQQIQRESIFKGIGLDPTQGVNKLFYETYSGELTEEAVKTAAQGYGLLSEEAPEVPDEQAQQQSSDEQAFQTMGQALQGSKTNDGAVDERQRADQVFKSTYSQTGNSDEAMAAVFNDRLKTTIQSRQN